MYLQSNAFGDTLKKKKEYKLHILQTSIPTSLVPAKQTMQLRTYQRDGVKLESLRAVKSLKSRTNSCGSLI